jgi:hypothetical protein
LSLKNPDIWRLVSHLQSLSSPAHVILFYGVLTELEDLKQGINAHEYPRLTVPPGGRQYSRSLPDDGEKSAGWALRRLREDEFSNPGKLIRTERRIQERRTPMRVACAYPIERFLGLGEDACIDILSLHSYAFFAKFSRGGLMLLESAENALSSALGRRGAEMIHNYLDQRGMERCTIPLRFPEYSDMLRELLGRGAHSLLLITYRNLFQKMRSSPEVFEYESRG